MADPLVSLTLLASFLLLVSAAYYFKTLDLTLWHEARVPIAAGAIAGVLLLTIERFDLPRALVTGVMLTAAAIWARLTGKESEPTHGMVFGAMSGAAAAVPLALWSDAPLLRTSECLLAGAAAGYGVTLGVAHNRERLRKLLLDGASATFAVLIAATPALVGNAGINGRQLAIASAALIPLLVVAMTFVQWPRVRAELEEEAALGVLEQEDVRPTAHPLRRLGRGGWFSASAHREFVRIAHEIALRKRQQRRREGDVARLYQLEVIKLRMELQQMVRIDRMMRLEAAQASQT